MAVLTDTYSVRFPDVVVSFGRNGKEHDNDRAIDDPEIIVELHAAGFARTNLATKLEEYRRLASLSTMLIVDTEAQRIRLIQRTGPSSWTDVAYREPTDAVLPSLNLTIPYAEIFARLIDLALWRVRAKRTGRCPRSRPPPARG